ncbi:Urease accessory protein UreD OS=Streptomyces fumanus OX=67302 GN=ureD PE=3 SV=1 [Streptomyces fumanus]
MRIAGRCVLDQELSCGPGARAAGTAPPSWQDAAVGQIVVVRPEFAPHPPAARVCPAGAAVLPLAGPAVLLTAVAPDALQLRRALDEALAALG